MSVRRNALLNLLGTALPLLLGAITIPYLISQIGVESFGILTLIWAIVGYFSIFDFGLGRALTQLVASIRASGDLRQLPGIIKNGIFFTAVAGVIGGTGLALIAHDLAVNWLNISVELQHSAWIALLIAAVGVPFTTLTAGLRGILEGYEDFKIVNLLRVALGMANFGLPALIVIYFSTSLIWMVASLIVARVVITLLHVWFVRLKILSIWTQSSVAKKTLKRLLSFGAWMTLSNIISPLMVTADRFVISMFLGAGYVAYYTVPFEVLSRILVIPAALAGALFPRLAAVIKIDAIQAYKIYINSLKVSVLVLLPICLIVAFLSNLGLSMWISSDFADKSWMIASILSIGVFFNGVAFVPYALVQSSGNARGTAILHMFEFVLYLPVLFFSIKIFGIAGAAVAWSCRTFLDMLLLMRLSRNAIVI